MYEKNPCESLILFNFQAAAGGGNKMAKADDFDKIDIKKEAEAGRVSTLQNMGLVHIFLLFKNVVKWFADAYVLVIFCQKMT